MNEKMKCGHKPYDSFLTKDDGFIFIRYKCVEGCFTEWKRVCETPLADEIDMEEG